MVVVVVVEQVCCLIMDEHGWANQASSAWCCGSGATLFCKNVPTGWYWPCRFLLLACCRPCRLDSTTVITPHDTPNQRGVDLAEAQLYVYIHVCVPIRVQARLRRNFNRGNNELSYDMTPSRSTLTLLQTNIALNLVSFCGLLACVVLCSCCHAAKAVDVLQAAAVSAGVKPQTLFTASKMTRRTPGNLAHLLTTDKSVSLTAGGAVRFGCHLHEHDHPHGTTGVLGFNPSLPAGSGIQTSIAQMGMIDPGDAFRLHSRNSTLKIFLQFAGCVTEVGMVAA